ncbi:hypothetical protein FFLO_06276 [Filobasidium floriforme]|uniref:Integrase catalytic domain-containing protein n=1 Tax=Filobasidium floriforme TaxID=5210 RepID=A0A8K0JKW2_9TREE|nr:hypothetical protein FFLO_06276 [Filobasidium floriforme]
MDDLFCGHNTWEEHIETLRTLAKRAIEFGIKWSPEKTKIGYERVRVGGQVVSRDGAEADPAKIEAIKGLPRPTTALEVLAFVNKVGFFRRSIVNFAIRARALTDLTRDIGVGRKGSGKGKLKRALATTKVVWTDTEQAAFDDLKGAMETMIKTFAPIYDGETPFHVDVDACAEGFGAHLYQMVQGVMKTIEFASRRTAGSEREEHSFTLELKGVRWCLDRFRPTIWGQRIIIHTDCEAVKSLLNNDKLTFQQAAWKEAILSSGVQEFVHKPGKQNGVADFLSRNAVGDNTEPIELGNDSLMDAAPIRWLDGDGNEALRRRFEGDPLYMVVCFLTKLINSDDDIVVKKAKLYHVAGGKLWKRNKETADNMEVLTSKEGRTRACSGHEECGHFGRDLTIRHIQKRETWNSIGKDVTQAIAGCEVCAKFGARVTNSQMRNTLRYSPMDAMAIDYLYMPTTESGFRVILVGVDVYSKFIFGWAFAREPSTATTITALTDLRRTHMLPHEVICDNGSHFVSKEMRKWFEDCGIAVTPAAPFAHVGLVENANHLVLDRIRRLIHTDVNIVGEITKGEEANTWPQRLPPALAALNDRQLTVLGGLSPREAMFGRSDDRRLPLDLAATMQKIEVLRDGTREARDADIEKSKSATKLQTYPFAVGQLVQVYDPKKDATFESIRKLKTKWSGPYRIVQLSRGSATLSTIDGLPAGRAGFDRLRPYNGVVNTDDGILEKDI